MLEVITNEAREGTLSRFRNRYRFELPRTEAESSITRVVPIVVVSWRAFRGRYTPDLAAVIPGLAREFSLTPDPEDLLGYVADRHKVVRSVEWQEAFDQGRRRHEPRSVGFLLRIKREILTRIAEARGVELWAHLTAKRSTDRYKPESDMKWHEHSDVDEGE